MATDPRLDALMAMRMGGGGGGPPMMDPRVAAMQRMGRPPMPQPQPQQAQPEEETPPEDAGEGGEEPTGGMMTGDLETDTATLEEAYKLPPTPENKQRWEEMLADFTRLHGDENVPPDVQEEASEPSDNTKEESTE